MAQCFEKSCQLEDINKIYNPILLDTSALDSCFEFDSARCFNGVGYVNPILFKISLVQSLKEFLLQEENLFLTMGVSREIRKGNRNFYSWWKCKESNLFYTSKNSLVELKTLHRERRELEKKLNQEGIIRFDMDEEEKYSNYFREFFSVKSKFNLSWVDYDLLITSMVLSLNASSSVAIISNDIDIAKAKEEICKLDQFGYDVQVFSRKGLEYSKIIGSQFLHN